jgi:hypothetical protein
VDDALTHYRYERKFLAEGLPLGEVQWWVKRNPALFFTEFPDRAVNNIYFDTPSLNHYFANMDGVRDRTKVRIRWYGPLLGWVDKPVLELKIKQGLLGRKVAHRLHPFRVDENFCGHALLNDGVLADVPEELKLHLVFHEPSLVNRYQRQYYRSADRHFRLTIDHDLQFYRLGHEGNPLSEHPRPVDRIVLELKYTRAHSELADRVSNAFPFRLTRMSKYAVGVEAVHYA